MTNCIYTSRLREIIDDLEIKDKYCKQLIEIESNIREQNSKLQSYILKLKKQKTILCNFEKNRLISALYKAFNKYEDKICHAREEILNMQRDCHEMAQYIGRLEVARETFENKINSLNLLDEEFNKLLIDKEQFLVKSNSNFAKELQILDNEMISIANSIIEFDHLISFGNEVSEAIKKVVKTLESAIIWGYLDISKNDGIATLVKNKRVETANNDIKVFQNKLLVFKSKFQYLYLNYDLSININSFEYFADFVLDGLFIDCLIQSKINESFKNSRYIKTDIENMLKVLSNKKSQLLDRQMKLFKQRNSLIIES